MKAATVGEHLVRARHWPAPPLSSHVPQGRDTIIPIPPTGKLVFEEGPHASALRFSKSGLQWNPVPRMAQARLLSPSSAHPGTILSPPHCCTLVTSLSEVPRP